MASHGKVFPAHTMKAYGNVKIKRHSFLGLELDGDEWSASGPGRFTALVRALFFMVPLCLVPALDLLFFYVSTFRSTCAVPSMAVFSSSLTSLLLLLLFAIVQNRASPSSGCHSCLIHLGGSRDQIAVMSSAILNYRLQLSPVPQPKYTDINTSYATTAFPRTFSSSLPRSHSNF